MATTFAVELIEGKPMLLNWKQPSVIIDISTLIDNNLVCLPVIETPSTIVRESLSGEDLSLLASMPELVYEYTDGVLDIVGEFT